MLRYDPPVQNTRRFVVEDGVVAGRALKEGDAVLVLLAAANRDPAGKLFTFGAGPMPVRGRRWRSRSRRPGSKRCSRPASISEGSPKT
ncbi:MAG: hypothetical protein ACJ76J_08070 [Thermoanaerobaculia bacterium]